MAPFICMMEGESKAKQIAVLSFLSERAVGTECVHL